MRLSWFLLTIALIFSFDVQSQENMPIPRLRVAVFTQLYLDSSFTDDGVYKHDMLMPKYILPGLDFTEGLLIGADSLKDANNIEIRIYDPKTKGQEITTLKDNQLFDSIQLIIGAVSGNEYRQLSDLAIEYQIPFLSATFPNDGGITQNPFTILLNPTIGVHCNALVQFIHQSLPKSNLILLQKKTAQDERIRKLFENSNMAIANKKTLKWSFHIASDSFNLENIIPLMDSTRQNIIICASFDEKLATQCLNYTSSLDPYNIQFIGLPHWETMKEINLSKHKDKVIYYSTAFFNDGSVPFTSFQKLFLEKTEGKASDIAYKGYDIAVNFLQLLISHQTNFINQINDSTFQQLINYNIQPVKSKDSVQPDYFENKRIYIIKKTDGQLSKMGKF